MSPRNRPPAAATPTTCSSICATEFGIQTWTCSTICATELAVAMKVGLPSCF
jgi:hypothetical protein